MFVLHGHWHGPTSPKDQGSLLFWAEDGEASPPQASKGRQGKAARPHPFCADPRVLQSVLQVIFPQHVFYLSNSQDLRLPSASLGPSPSPQLVHDWDDQGQTPDALRAWTVSGLRLSPQEAFEALNGLPADEHLPAHLVIGPDCRFWQTASRFVLEALSQQKMVPTLSAADAGRKTFHARWLPVLDGPQDGPRVRQLLEGMPPLCRAEAGNGQDDLSGRLVLDTFLNTMLDTMAREWGPTSLPNVKAKERDIGHDWLSALFNRDPVVAGAAGQLQHMYQRYRAWLRNLHLAGDKAFRVALRLEAPLQQTEDSDNWQLHFLLQARDDPSLLVPARQVWQTKGNTLSTLDRRFERPQEKLLAGLGYAARLFPPLQAGLKTAKPVGMALTSEDAFSFLRDKAPLLEASGFGILVPPWWNQPGTRLGVRLKLASKQAGQQNIPSGLVTMDRLISYQWELSLGDTALTQDEFKALVALKSPLVQIRGQWVQLDPEQIEAAINFWQKQTLAGEVTLPEAMRLGLDSSTTVGGLPVEGVALDDHLAGWMAKVSGGQKLTELPPPEGLQATLRPYQSYGYAWMEFLRELGLGACLADDMGLGKTIQTITLLLREKEERGALPGPSLLICPTSVVANWEKEVARFAPDLTTMMHQGPQRLRDKALVKQAKSTDLVLTSYAIARRDVPTLNSIDWFGVILDEAQNIKNAQTKQARAARQLSAQFRLALTGTPVENRLSELWSIMQFLNPNYLGSQQKFRQTFALPIERSHDEEASERLKKLISPFILRRVKTDPTVIQDLPDKQEMKVYCQLSEEQATLYEAVVAEAMGTVAGASGIERRGLVLAMLMKLKQICNHPAQFLHQVSDEMQSDWGQELQRSGKLQRLTELLDEILAVEDRTLIFTQFSEMGKYLKSYLQQRLGVPTIFLHGGTPPKSRATMIERFQEDANGPPIFILSLKAGGTGLNLTRANHVFHFDRWWNPAVEDQATDRAFRIGQTQNVQVHKFVCVGTMEEMVDEMIESKKALADRIVGQGENWLTEMSTDELRDMVTLRREVMA